VHAYEQHFGFREPPFSVTPDPRFFYANPAYREAYSTLRYGVEARKGFILVTGEAGTGKTTLLRMLMQHADSGIQTAYIFNPPTTFTELLRVILNELELPEMIEDRATMTAQLNDYLLDQFKQGHIVSVLIDEAQTLSHEMLEQLRLLSNLETRNAKLVQIVLMGQPELEQKLDKPELRQLKQCMALRCRIQPLSPEDVAQYIDFRLAVAGYEGEELFNRGGIKKIALYSQGIPRLINVLCDNALLRACRDGASKVSVEIINEAARDLRLDQLPAPAPDRTPAESSKGSFLKQPLSIGGKRVSARNRVAIFRDRVDWPTFQFGLWFIMVMGAAAGMVLYWEGKGLRLTPIASYVQEHIGTRRNNSVQREEIIDPEPRVGPHTNRVARIGPPSVETANAISAGFNRGSENGEGFADRRNLEATANSGQVKMRPNETVKEEAGERGGSRVVVRLDQEKPVRITGRAKEQRSLGVFNVVGASLVREKPTADAEITGSLQPGSRVRVVGKAGDYLRVHALDAHMMSGYVHVEDAFFEPIR
jgi:general secretion pathway protein A